MFKKVDCQMEARTGIALALLLLGCAQPQMSEGNSEPILAVTPTVAPRPARQKWSTPRRFKLRLTLDRPEDLKVKVGDGVIPGQVISDRKFTRIKLIQEQEVLQRQLKQLQNQTNISRDAVEQAEVEQARLKVEQARGAIATFHADSPWTDHAHRVLPLPDRSQLRVLEGAHQEARGELAFAVAKLQEAQQQGVVNSDVSAQRAELLGKIREIENQMDSLGVVRSPYSGVVKAIKWLGQVDREIQVELTLNVGPESNEAPNSRQVN